MVKLDSGRKLTRRSFIISAGMASGSLALGLRLCPLSPLSHPPQPTEINTWILVNPDNSVTIQIAQMEMGQGSLTTMVQLIAEELEVDWKTIKTEFISINKQISNNRPYGRTETEASEGLCGSELILRTAGAQIKSMLLSAAATRLSVPLSHLVARNSTIRHTSSGRRLLYSEVVEDASELEIPAPDSITLKDRQQWKFLGKSVPRLDIPSKVTGTVKVAEMISKRNSKLKIEHGLYKRTLEIS